MVNKCNVATAAKAYITIAIPLRYDYDTTVTGRWVCDDRFYGLVNRSNR